MLVTDLEARHQFRVDCRFFVSYSILESEAVDLVTNLSSGGLFIQTDNFASKGSEIHFTLFPHQHFEPVAGVGVVSWASKTELFPIDRGVDAFGLGISFRGLPPEKRARINRIINYLRSIHRVLGIDLAEQPLQAMG